MIIVILVWELINANSFSGCADPEEEEGGEPVEVKQVAVFLRLVSGAVGVSTEASGGERGEEEEEEGGLERVLRPGMVEMEGRLC